MARATLLFALLVIAGLSACNPDLVDSANRQMSEPTVVVYEPSMTDLDADPCADVEQTITADDGEVYANVGGHNHCLAVMDYRDCLARCPGPSTCTCRNPDAGD